MNFNLTVKKAISLGAGCGFLQYLLRGKTAVFMLHRVVDEEYYRKCSFQKSILVTEKSFRTFIERLEKQCNIISLGELLQSGGTRSSKSMKPQAVLTFDDGWLDNYELAFPILKEKGLPATIFLSTDYIDTEAGCWWQGLGEVFSDPELSPSHRNDIETYIRENLGADYPHFDFFQDIDLLVELLKNNYSTRAMQISKDVLAIAGRQLNNYGLTWKQCREMSEHGIEFGSHTLSHARLPDLSDDQLTKELVESKRILEEQKVKTIDAICYPYGAHDERTLQFAQKYYAFGFTIEAGIFSDIDDKPMAIPRININEDVAADKLWLQYRVFKAILS